jgi:hypothetical protein
MCGSSTIVETNRYEYEVRFIKSSSSKKFEKKRVKQYLKWHVTYQVKDNANVRFASVINKAIARALDATTTTRLVVVDKSHIDELLKLSLL